MEGLKFLLINSNFSNLGHLSNNFQTFQQNKKYINWDLVATDFISKLNALNSKLEDQKTNLLSFQNSTLGSKGFEQVIVSFFKIMKKTNELNALIYLNIIIALILNDVFLQAKSDRKFNIFHTASNSKYLIEILVI